MASSTVMPWQSGLVSVSWAQKSWASTSLRFSFWNRGAPVSTTGGWMATPFSRAAAESRWRVRSTKANRPVPVVSRPSVHRATTTWSAWRRICTSTFSSWAVKPSKESTATVHPWKKALPSKAWARRVRSSRESR